MTDQLKALIEEMEERKLNHNNLAFYCPARLYYEGKESECAFIIEKLKLILNETPTAPLNGE